MLNHVNMYKETNLMNRILSGDIDIVFAINRDVVVRTYVNPMTKELETEMDSIEKHTGGNEFTCKEIKNVVRIIEGDVELKTLYKDKEVNLSILNTKQLVVTTKDGMLISFKSFGYTIDKIKEKLNNIFI